MEEKLIHYFSKFAKLSAEEQTEITKDINIGHFKKGSMLLKEGQKPIDNYFVLEGCVRQYIIKNEDERVTHFYCEEDWILPAIGEHEDKRSTYFLECLEASVLVIANEKEGNKMLKTNQTFQDLAQLLLEQEIIKQQQHFTEFQNSTPEERYIKLQDTRPDLIERVPQFQLSSYIGVTPESLSRIRKRIAGKMRNS